MKRRSSQSRTAQAVCIALVVSFLEGSVPGLEYIITNTVFTDNFGRMLLTVTLSGKKVDFMLDLQSC